MSEPQLRWARQRVPKDADAKDRISAGYDLRKGGVPVAHVRAILSAWDRKVVGWYWYGFGPNSRDKPVNLAGTAKMQCLEAYKKHLETHTPGVRRHELV